MDGEKGESALKWIRENKAMAIAKSVAMGQGVALAILLGFTALFALLICNETITESSAGYCVWATLVLSSVGGSLTSVWGNKESALILSGIFGAVYLLLLLCVNALFFGGQYAGAGAALILIMGASLTVGLISFVRKGQSGYHRFKYKKHAIV